MRKILFPAVIALVLASGCRHGDNQVYKEPIPPGSANNEEVDVKSLVKKLGSDDFAERQRAFDAIVEIGRKAIPEVQANLQNPDAEIRLRCNQLMRYLRLGLTPKIEKEVLGILAESMAEKDVGVDGVDLENVAYAALIPKVRKIGKPAIYVLADAAADKSSPVESRLVAFYAISNSCDDEYVRGHLKEFIEDDSIHDHIRKDAMFRLSSFSSEDVFPFLADFYKRTFDGVKMGRDPEMLETALYCVANLRDRRVPNFLVPLVQDENLFDSLRSMAARGLVEFEPQQYEEMFIGLLDSEKTGRSLRSAIEYMLAGIADKESILAIKKHFGLKELMKHRDLFKTLPPAEQVEAVNAWRNEFSNLLDKEQSGAKVDWKPFWLKSAFAGFDEVLPHIEQQLIACGDEAKRSVLLSDVELFQTEKAAAILVKHHKLVDKLKQPSLLKSAYLYGGNNFKTVVSKAVSEIVDDVKNMKPGDASYYPFLNNLLELIIKLDIKKHCDFLEKTLTSTEYQDLQDMCLVGLVQLGNKEYEKRLLESAGERSSAPLIKFVVENAPGLPAVDVERLCSLWIADRYVGTEDRAAAAKALLKSNKGKEVPEIILQTIHNDFDGSVRLELLKTVLDSEKNVDADDLTTLLEDRFSAVRLLAAGQLLARGSLSGMSIILEEMDSYNLDDSFAARCAIKERFDASYAPVFLDKHEKVEADRRKYSEWFEKNKSKLSWDKELKRWRVEDRE